MHNTVSPPLQLGKKLHSVDVDQMIRWYMLACLLMIENGKCPKLLLVVSTWELQLCVACCIVHSDKLS